MTNIPESVGELYTPIAEAIKELRRRRADGELMQRVNSFFEPLPPMKEFLGPPKAFYSRNIASPTLETERFLEMTKGHDLSGLFLEYLSDKFVAKNREKYSLCNMSFVKGPPEKPGRIIRRKRIVNFNIYEGKAFKNIKTDWGEPLADCHHRLMHASKMDAHLEILDFSDWFNTSRKFGRDYYRIYLGLFLTHGILFENFLFDSRELEFTTKKVIPAFEHIREMFGLKPLIVPIAPIAIAESLSWSYYNEKILALI